MNSSMADNPKEWQTFHDFFRGWGLTGEHNILVDDAMRLLQIDPFQVGLDLDNLYAKLLPLLQQEREELARRYRRS